MKEPRYPINLYWSQEDRCWLAEVPDLYPCMSHGDTREQALANIEDAIEGWLETAQEMGFDIPEPSYKPITRAA